MKIIFSIFPLRYWQTYQCLLFTIYLYKMIWHWAHNCDLTGVWSSWDKNVVTLLVECDHSVRSLQSLVWSHHEVTVASQCSLGKVYPPFWRSSLLPLSGWDDHIVLTWSRPLAAERSLYNWRSARTWWILRRRITGITRGNTGEDGSTPNITIKMP